MKTLIDPFTVEETIARLTDLGPFISYLEATADDDWQTQVVRSEDGKRNCMFGHLVNWFYGEDTPDDWNVGRAWDYFEEMWSTTYYIYGINDGENANYKQATPKLRVIAYLRNLQSGKELTTHEAMDAEFKELKRLKPELFE